MNTAALSFVPSDCAIDRIAVALIDDHVAMRDALALALLRDPAMEVVATGGSADEALGAAEAAAPDVILLDLNMPGSGLTAAERLARAAPASKIIMLTSADEAHLVDAALAAGASAFITKGTPVAAIRQTIRHVLAGKSFITPSLAANLLRRRPLAAPWGGEPDDQPFELLEREEQILLRLAQGLSNEEIGAGIGLEPASVEAFITNVLMKLHTVTAALAQD